VTYTKYLDNPYRRGNVGDRDHFQHIENALQGVVPGPGEVIVGGADGPEPVAGAGLSGVPYGARPPRMHHLITTMQAGHGFTRFTATGQMAEDTSVFALGSQSVRLTPEGTSTTGIRKTDLTPFDMTNHDLLVWVRVDNPNAWTTLRVNVSSDNFASAFAVRTMDTQNATRPYALPGEWVALTLPTEQFAVTGDVDFSAINAIDFRVGSSLGEPVSMWINGAALVERAPHAVVSVTFDDGNANQFTRGLPVLSKYAIPATAYIIAERIGWPGYLTLEQLRQMHSLHGWEIAAHSFLSEAHSTRYPPLTEAETVRDFQRIRAWLIDNGFGDGANHFAYPGGWYDEKTLRQVRRFFASARTVAENVHETLPAGDPYRLRIYNMLNTRSAASIIEEIDKAIASKSWLILVLHEITPPGQADGPTKYPEDELDTVMAYLRSSGVDVRTVGDVIRNGV
jgi:peptidoglycan/xylan/chitin deacetylase (PgdA/CDA1 family)